MVELAFGVTVILEDQGGEFVEALARQAFEAKFELFGRQGNAAQMGLVVAGDGFGETAPATADFEHG
ncbi:hypothetical protein D9M68_907640 [compost metagenome]